MPDTHGQYPSRASGQTGRPHRTGMQRSAVIAASAGIDGRADEWDRRAACVSAKATTATETKVTPSTWSPACAAAVCREGTGRNQGDPETAIASAGSEAGDKGVSGDGWRQRQ